MLTAPYVFDIESTIAMTEAGADIVVPHMGLTTAGTIGAQTAITLDESVARIQEMHDAAVAVNAEVIVLCHGGPIAEPEDVAYILHTHFWSCRLLRCLLSGAPPNRTSHQAAGRRFQVH